MARSPAKSGSSRSKILEVSIRLFAKHGFEGVSMRQISKEASITLPAIYHHFGNKEDLFKAVETEVYSAHETSLLDQLHSEGTAEEKLRGFIFALISNLEKNPDYFKLLQRNLVDGWEDNQKFLVELSLQNVFDELKELLNEYSPNSGNGINPIFIFSIIVGVLTMQPVTRILKNYKYTRITRKEKQDIVVDSTLNFIKANLNQ